MWGILEKVLREPGAQWLLVAHISPVAPVWRPFWGLCVVPPEISTAPVSLSEVSAPVTQPPLVWCLTPLTSLMVVTPGGGEEGNTTGLRLAVPPPEGP